MAASRSGASRRVVADDDQRHGLLFVAIMALFMWVEEIVDSALGGDLDAYGIVPREVDGLDGIAFSPFLHAGFDHLVGNTIPFLILGGTIALSGLARIASVTLVIALVGGLGTWLTGPAGSVHIGASGIVFGYAAYLVARWLYTRRITHVMVAVAVIAVWGATLLGGLAPRDGISWQGHLFGALGGLFAAWLLDGRDRRRHGRTRSASGAGFVR